MISLIVIECIQNMRKMYRKGRKEVLIWRKGVGREMGDEQFRARGSWPFDWSQAYSRTRTIEQRPPPK